MKDGTMFARRLLASSLARAIAACLLLLQEGPAHPDELRDGALALVDLFSLLLFFLGLTVPCGAVLFCVNAHSL